METGDHQVRRFAGQVLQFIGDAAGEDVGVLVRAVDETRADGRAHRAARHILLAAMGCGQDHRQFAGFDQDQVAGARGCGAQQRGECRGQQQAHHAGSSGQ